MSRADYGGARLLVSDVRVAFLLLDEARCAIVARLFGVARDDSLLVSIVALGALAQVAHDKATGALQTGPSVGDSMIGVSVLREITHRLGGGLYRDTPIFGSLIAIAFLGASVRAAQRMSSRGVKAGAHRARVGFDHRYGHLLGRRQARS